MALLCALLCSLSCAHAGALTGAYAGTISARMQVHLQDLWEALFSHYCKLRIIRTLQQEDVMLILLRLLYTG